MKGDTSLTLSRLTLSCRRPNRGRYSVASRACWLCKTGGAVSRVFCHVTHANTESGEAYLGGVALVEGVLDHQAFQHLDGDLTDLPELLQGCVHLPEQQPHQEVVLAEVVGQRVIQLEVCREEEGEKRKRRRRERDVRVAAGGGREQNLDF